MKSCLLYLAISCVMVKHLANANEDENKTKDDKDLRGEKSTRVLGNCGYACNYDQNWPYMLESCDVTWLGSPRPDVPKKRSCTCFSRGSGNCQCFGDGLVLGCDYSCLHDRICGDNS